MGGGVWGLGCLEDPGTQFGTKVLSTLLGAILPDYHF